MKILYLCPDLGIPVLGHKGASVHVREMATALARQGHQITVAAQSLTKSPWDTPAPFAVPVIHVRPATSVSAAVQGFKGFNELLGLENSFPGELRRILYNQDLIEAVRRRFEDNPPDFIYERASLHSTAGVALARDFGVPLIVELNAPLAVEQEAYRSTGFGNMAAKAERWLLTEADAVLAVSAELKSHVVGLGVPTEKVHIFPNAVNPELFRPGKPDAQLRAQLGLNGHKIVGFVGGLRPWHGVEALPQLLARLTKKDDGVRMIIAGEGPLRRDLQCQFKKLALEQKVTFTGPLAHEAIPGVIRQFDVALAPYPKLNHEFYFSPLKLFEYMACGIAVVAADVGQISKVISHNRTGLLYTPGNLDRLTGHCGDLLANAKLRKMLGAAAARKIGREFTWDHNAERVAQLAQGLIKKKSA